MPGRSCERTCPLWWAPLILRRGGGQVRAGPAAGRVHAWWEVGTPGGLPGERLAHDGVGGGWPGAFVHLVGCAGAGGRRARTFHFYRDFAQYQVR